VFMFMVAKYFVARRRLEFINISGRQNAISIGKSL